MEGMRRKAALLLCVLAIRPAAAAPTRSDPRSDALPSAAGVDWRVSVGTMFFDRDSNDDAIRLITFDRVDPLQSQAHATVLIGASEFGDVWQTCEGVAAESIPYDAARYAQGLRPAAVEERNGAFEVALTSERIGVYVVSEPVSISLMAAGLVALSVVRRRRTL